jgi:AcrR family transcriptional regulator
MESTHGVERLRVLLEEGMPLDQRRMALCRIFVFFWGEAVGDDFLSAEQRRFYDDWRLRVRETLEEGQRDGWLRPIDDTQLLAEMLVAAADGLTVQATFQPGAITPERQRAHVNTWLRFLAADGQAEPTPTGW